LKTPKKAAEPKDSLSFEQAIQRLEKIVADMEAAELPLEDVLKRYEEGTRLVRFCTTKLDEAEKKIELLTKKADGAVALKPFAADETDDGDEKEAKLL
jgi:exodeoxyribonuclease VII small subunit